MDRVALLKNSLESFRSFDYAHFGVLALVGSQVSGFYEIFSSSTFIWMESKRLQSYKTHLYGKYPNHFGRCRLLEDLYRKSLTLKRLA